MSPSLSNLLDRAWRIGGVVLLIALAVVQVRLTLADHHAEEEPTAALRYWPQHREAVLRSVKAWQTSAERSSPAPDSARRLLDIHPFSGAALAAMGLGLAHQGDVGGAEAFMNLAVRLAPRDRSIHVWLVDHHAARRDYPQAIAHIDQILRLSPGKGQALFQTINSLLPDDDARAAIVERLLQSPPWRQALVSHLARESRHLPHVAELMNALRKGSAPWPAVERKAWSDRLLREGLAGAAYLLWVDGLPPAQRRVVGNLYDGGFEWAPEAGAFGWQFGRIPGATISRQSGAGANGASLVVEFQHRHVRFQHVRQTLLLPPGRYRFDGRVRLDDLRTERGLRWRVRCLSGPQIGESTPFSGRRDWSGFGFDFDVPSEGCEAQVAELVLPARTRGEQWIGGRIRFDDLAVIRAPIPSASAPSAP